MSSTVFVQIYHPEIPETAANPALVPLQAVDDYAALGWLLVDPDAPPPATSTPYYTTAAADSRFMKVGDAGTSGTLTGDALEAASVAAVEGATTVAPAGAWDFAQAPTVAGVPVGSGGGGGATDAELRDRSTHTGTQTAATISDLREQVEDYVAALLGAGTNVTLTYTDNGEGAGSLTIAATGGTTDPEAVRDAIGIALVGAGLISVAVNDAGDTITISTTATTNSTDAQLRDRSTHTGSQAISTVTGLQTALDAKAPVAGVEGFVVHDGTAGGGTRPSGYARIRWYSPPGAAHTRPGNMTGSDLWEHDA